MALVSRLLYRISLLQFIRYSFRWTIEKVFKFMIVKSELLKVHTFRPS